MADNISEKINFDLFEPFEKLVTVRIEGKVFEVPENNSVLRALQFLDADMQIAKFCWNGECENCLFSYSDQSGSAVKYELACRQNTFDGMIITQLPQGVRIRK